MAIDRAAFFEAAKVVGIQRDKLYIPELKNDVVVRGMTGSERDKFEESLRLKTGKRAGQNDLRNFRAKFVARVVENPDGSRMFNDGEGDIAFLGTLPSGVLDRIITKSQELSGKTEAEVEALGEGSEPEAAFADSASRSPEN